MLSNIAMTLYILMIEKSRSTAAFQCKLEFVLAIRCWTLTRRAITEEPDAWILAISERSVMEGLTGIISSSLCATSQDPLKS